MNTRVKSSLLTFVLSYFIFSPISAQDASQATLQDQYQLSIKKVTEKITIDGELNEQTWQDVEVATDFWMSFPVDDRRVDAEMQTEVRMAYDNNFIYLSAVCFGSDEYVIQTLKRDSPDFWMGDAFGIVIDPVNERTNAFSFSINPAGVQLESLVTGQTGRRGDNSPGRPPTGINSAWDNKWFSQVRTYEDKWVAELAIPFKSLRFKASKTVWGINFIRSHTGTNSYHTWSPVPVQFRAVDLGYTGALVWDKAPQKVKNNVSLIPYMLGGYDQNLEDNEAAEFNFRPGLDAKVGITSSLNLDVTINPDFSQVDVDQQVTNLTRFNVRFPERRLFFLENADLFENFGIPPMRPFFSRRIGLDEDGNSIPILYGLRLSGNINKDLRVGLMNMQTQEVEDQSPAQNYTSFAVHQRVLKRSVVRGYFHNRQAMASGEVQKDDYNRTGGLEFNYQSLDGKWRGFAGYGLSFNNGYKDDNYFYNFGGGYDGRNISAYTNLAGVGNNYYADMGFIPRLQHYDALEDTSYHLGFHHWYSRYSYTLYPEKNHKIISHQLELRNIYDATTDWELIGNNLEINYNLRFTNTSSLQLSYSINDANLLFPFSFSSGEPLPAGKYHYSFGELSYVSDIRKLFNFQAGIQYGNFYNGERTQYSLTLKYRTQPWGNFGINFVQNDLDFPAPYENERLFLIGPRVEVNFSRSLFWTTFLQYNTQRDNFNINSRLQWRFQPMSDLFIVYTDNYAVELWGPKTRGLVIKLNYWLNL